MHYRRALTEGGTYFFTVVTFKRLKILNEIENLTLLRQAFEHVRKNHPFEIDAMVVLPEHLHCIWTLPKGDADFSTRWRLVKGFFTRNCHAKYRQKPFESRKRKREQAVWQRRFWEHLIRNEKDFIQHVEYIHYNPVKHGLVTAPIAWEYSSLHRYVAQGKYPKNWAATEKLNFDSCVGHE